jgi:hypothetical protein
VVTAAGFGARRRLEASQDARKGASGAPCRRGRRGGGAAHGRSPELHRRPVAAGKTAGSKVRRGAEEGGNDRAVQEVRLLTRDVQDVTRRAEGDGWR